MSVKKSGWSAFIAVVSVALGCGWGVATAQDYAAQEEEPAAGIPGDITIVSGADVIVTGNAQRYGYVVPSQGAYLPLGRQGGTALACLRFDLSAEKFHSFRLTYLGDGETPHGYVGEVYATSIGGHRRLILFSRNTDPHGNFYVVFKDPAAGRLVYFPARRCPM